jgi:hypothetical protein
LDFRHVAKLDQRLVAFDLVRLAAGHIKCQRLAVDPDKLLAVLAPIHAEPVRP